MSSDDDSLRDPGHLRSLIYSGAKWQLEQAIKHLTEEQARRLLSEALVNLGRPSLEIVK